MDSIAFFRILASSLDRSDPSLKGGKYGDGIVEDIRIDI
jgi:hypothetical protein